MFHSLLSKINRLSQPSRSCNSNRTHRRLVGHENLEERRLFVVGAEYVPDPLPGDQYDGVVRLDHKDAAGNVIASCSGSLLSTGKHILTAAHCMTNDSGQVDSASTDVVFRLIGGDIKLNVTASRYKIHPNWRGSEGHDLAVLDLPEVAPADADRYDLYRNTDERGQIVRIVGYGFTGSGGPSGSVDGQRRMMRNAIEGTSYSPLFGPDFGPDGTVLWYDHDGGLGSFEGWAARGDSGGPMLVGNQILGVASGVAETAFAGGDPEFEFGEDSVATRVSHYANWIDSITNATQSVRLNMNNQPMGNDMLNDTIQVFESSGTMRIMVGSLTVASVPSTSVQSLVIQGSTDNETIHLMKYFGSTITVQGGAGMDTLRGGNFTNDWVINSTGGGALNGKIFFSQIESLYGGDNSDRFIMQPFARMNGFLRGGASSNNDLIDYTTFHTGVNVDLLAGTATNVLGGISFIRHATGSEFDDTIHGNAEANNLKGNNGNDSIFGHLGDDWLFGGKGEDRLFGEVGVDRLFGGEDNDYLDGGYDGVSDFLYGEGGVDTFALHRVGKWKLIDGKLTYMYEIESDTTDRSLLLLLPEWTTVFTWDTPLTKTGVL